MINLLRHRLSTDSVSVIELDAKANEHLNTMYASLGINPDRETINSRAIVIARWLYDTHRTHVGAKVLLGDVPALIPALSARLEHYGFIPTLPVEIPTLVTNDGNLSYRLTTPNFYSSV